ncbi:MAG TPA: flagellar biosynthesis anti-sigma factor FlgM [Edaphobacter sp.]|jgi:negative regulator of flagellin synthesis FlgM
MSYASGIGNAQTAINSIAPSEAKPSIQTSASNGTINEQPVATDQTNLSSTGGLVAQALEGSDTRSAKVASLQQAISAGSYHVSSLDIADKIIQSLVD